MAKKVDRGYLDTLNTSIDVPANYSDYCSTSATQTMAQDDTPLYITLVIMVALIAFENGLMISAFAFKPSLRRRQANILVCSQAVADLVNGIVFIPVYCIERYKQLGIITPYVVAYILFVSLFNLFVLALDRFLAIIKPLLHHVIMDVNRTIKVVVIVWIIPLFITLLPLFWWTEPKHVQSFLPKRIYVAFMWAMMMVICIFMAIMYFIVYMGARRSLAERQKQMHVITAAFHKNDHVVLAEEGQSLTELRDQESKTNNSPSINTRHSKKKRKNEVESKKRQMRVTHLFGLLLFFFVLAYLPILYMNLMDVINKPEWIPSILIDLSLFSLVLNSVVNPILCIYLKKDYQQAVKKMLCRNILKRNNDGSPRSFVSKSTLISFGKASTFDAD